MGLVIASKFMKRLFFKCEPTTFIPKAFVCFAKVLHHDGSDTRHDIYTRTKGKVNKTQLHNECGPPKPKVDHGCDVEMKPT